MLTERDVRVEWVNLSMHRLRWNPEDLERARGIVRQRLDRLMSEGWEVLSSAEDYGVLRQGRGLNGPVVIGARLELRRRGEA